MRIDILFLEMF